jgi:t-SNARE complex subunit (syntaxin)
VQLWVVQPVQGDSWQGLDVLDFSAIRWVQASPYPRVVCAAIVVVVVVIVVVVVVVVVGIANSACV